VAGKDGKEGENEGDLAVAGGVEGEAHAALADLLGLRHLGVVRAVIGPALVPEQGLAEEHILGRDRRAVGEAGLGIEVEGDGAAIFGQLDAFRDQAVERERLVAAARHQALEHVLAHVAGGNALVGEGVEAVEGALCAQHEASALGGGRVDVREMLEARGVLGGAVHGNAVHRLGRARGDGEQEGHKQGGN
jgi:hypothetical protein